MLIKKLKELQLECDPSLWNGYKAIKWWNINFIKIWLNSQEVVCHTKTLEPMPGLKPQDAPNYELIMETLIPPNWTLLNQLTILPSRFTKLQSTPMVFLGPLILTSINQPLTGTPDIEQMRKSKNSTYEPLIALANTMNKKGYKTEIPTFFSLLSWHTRENSLTLYFS
jgi:hypothetical protein